MRTMNNANKLPGIKCEELMLFKQIADHKNTACYSYHDTLQLLGWMNLHLETHVSTFQDSFGRRMLCIFAFGQLTCGWLGSRCRRLCISHTRVARLYVRSDLHDATQFNSPRLDRNCSYSVSTDTAGPLQLRLHNSVLHQAQAVECLSTGSVQALLVK